MTPWSGATWSVDRIVKKPGAKYATRLGSWVQASSKEEAIAIVRARRGDRLPKSAVLVAYLSTS